MTEITSPPDKPGSSRDETQETQMGSLLQIAQLLGFDVKEELLAALPKLLDQALAASVAANQPPATTP